MLGGSNAQQDVDWNSSCCLRCPLLLQNESMRSILKGNAGEAIHWPKEGAGSRRAGSSNELCGGTSQKSQQAQAITSLFKKGDPLMQSKQRGEPKSPTLDSYKKE